MQAETRALWVWPLMSVGGATALTAVLSNSLFIGATAGVTAGLFTFTGAQLVARRFRRQAEALVAAARGQTVPSSGGSSDDPDDPARLARDVQATAATAKENARQLAVLRAVVDGMAEGVWITDADGTVVQHNNALKEMLFSGQELIGRLPGDLVHSDELQSAVSRACRDGASARLEITHEGVLPRTLSIHVSPLGRDLPGSAAVFFDVTELRHLEKVRKDFVANVSHELRTPITAIRGYAETLKDGAVGDLNVAPKMVDIIHRQSERLSELVDDLLELSRIESKLVQLAEKPIDLAEAAQRAIEAVRPKARARSSTIELNISPGLHALGDQRAVEQVVLNLVDNAVKYTQPGGHVWVSAKRSDEGVEVSIRDDGPGIEAKHLPRLFERFYRVDKGRSRDMGGTGLGLSIVKHLVTAMKGEVRVESSPGTGSTFFIQLPVPQPPTANHGNSPLPS